jgi:hypothetical protein
MTAVTDAREDLVAALADAVSVKVYPTPPPTPIAPCVVVACGSPWITPERLGGPLQARVSWKVLVVVRDDAGHVPALEALVETVLGALPDGYVCDSVGPPSSLDIGAQGSVMVTEINLTARLI